MSNFFRLIKSGFRRYLLFFCMNTLPLSFLRISCLRIAGVTVGNDCYIGFGVMPDTNYPELISIGNNVTISHNCTLVTHTQSPVSSYLSGKYNYCGPIVIEDGAWVSINSTILPRVTLEKDVFIGAGSVVTRGKYKSKSLYAGNPCIFIKSL